MRVQDINGNDNPGRPRYSGTRFVIEPCYRAEHGKPQLYDVVALDYVGITNKDVKIMKTIYLECKEPEMMPVTDAYKTTVVANACTLDEANAFILGWKRGHADGSVDLARTIYEKYDCTRKPGT